MSLKCEMLVEKGPSLSITVAYIAVTRGHRTLEYAKRFANTWKQFPPGYPCQLWVICNGGPLAPNIAAAFDGMDARFIPRPNDPGYDISAYQQAAESLTGPTDFLVCFGESCYFHREGWLARMAQARLEYGPGMYGVFSTNNVRTHLHTTAFGIDPKFLRMYPPVKNHDGRYEFEHGAGCLWHRLGFMGGRAWLVTWDGVWEPQDWRKPANIISCEDQSNCLAYCNHTQRHEEANALNRFTWNRNANAPFKL
jgi:hypothetical protein